MKIAHIINSLEIGGAEVQLYQLLRHFDGRNTHMVISLTPQATLQTQFQQAGIEVMVFDCKKSFFLELIRLIKFIKKSRPDIVQTWMYHADLIGGIAARLAGIKVIIWGVRTTRTYGIKIKLIKKMCALFSYLIPKKIVCVANAAKKAHILAGYAKKPMTIVYNGFNVETLIATKQQRNILRRQCGIDESDIVIGCLGRFTFDKDYQNFIIAAGLIAQRYSQVKFLMVGRQLIDANDILKKFVVKTGYANRFILLGERHDVPACLSAMDIFCLASRNEGFPNALGEAMAMSLPSVVTDVGDSAMLIGNAGVVVPKENAKALAEGLNQLLTMSHEERTVLGQQAKMRIDQKFTIAQACKNFDDIYQSFS